MVGGEERGDIFLPIPSTSFDDAKEPLISLQEHQLHRVFLVYIYNETFPVINRLFVFDGFKVTFLVHIPEN